MAVMTYRSILCVKRTQTVCACVADYSCDFTQEKVPDSHSTRLQSLQLIVSRARMQSRHSHCSRALNIAAPLFVAVAAIHILSRECSSARMMLALWHHVGVRLFSNRISVRFSVSAVTILWFGAMCVIHMVTGFMVTAQWDSAPWPTGRKCNLCDPIGVKAFIQIVKEIRLNQPVAHFLWCKMIQKGCFVPSWHRTLNPLIKDIYLLFWCTSL